MCLQKIRNVIGGLIHIWPKMLGDFEVWYSVNAGSACMISHTTELRWGSQTVCAV